MGEYIVIVNPQASSGNGKKHWEYVKKELKAKKIKFTCLETKYKYHAKQLIERVFQQQESILGILIVGGDGTIQEVVSGMPLQTSVPIGIIPSGTGNDFARSINQLKFRRKQMLGDLIRVKWYDVGEFHLLQNKQTGRFVNAVGAGFDAEVGKVANESKLKRLFNFLHIGSLSYVIALIRVLFTYKRNDVTVEVDNQVNIYQNVWFVTVSNTPFYGGGMKISPEAVADDGLLNVIIVHQISKMKLLTVFATVFFGKHVHFKGVDTLTGKSIKINCNSSLPVHADGELIGTTPFEINVQHKAISVLTKGENTL